MRQTPDDTMRADELIKEKETSEQKYGLLNYTTMY